MIHLTNGSFVPLISQLRVNTYTSRTTNSMLLFSAMDATRVGDGEFPQTVNLEILSHPTRMELPSHMSLCSFYLIVDLCSRVNVIKAIFFYRWSIHPWSFPGQFVLKFSLPHWRLSSYWERSFWRLYRSPWTTTFSRLIKHVGTAERANSSTALLLLFLSSTS